LIVQGFGDLQQFTIKSLNSKFLQGAIKATGKVNWQPKLAAQLDLDVKKITIKDFWKDWPDKLRLNSRLRAKLDDNKFKISALNVTLPPTNAKVSLQGDGSLAGSEPKFDATLAWQKLQWPLVGKESLVTSNKGKVKLTGTPQNYRVNLNTQLDSAQTPPGNLIVQGFGDLQQFTIKSLNSKFLQGAIKATGKVNWQPKLAAQLDLDVNKITIKDFWKDWPDKLRLNSRLRAKLDNDRFKIKTLNVTLPPTNAKVSLQGDGSLAGSEPKFDATLAWQKLQWPLVGSNSLANSNKGTLNIKGTPQAYKLVLNTDVEGQNIPKGNWQAAGSGDTRSLQLKSLQGKVLQGALDLSGKVSWQPEISWQLALQGDKINPGNKWPKWPGKLGLDIRSQGRLKNGALETQVIIKQIEGSLRDYPLKLGTEIFIQGNDYDIKKLNFRNGNNRVTASGKLGKNSKLNWSIKAPNLAALLPEGQGKFIAKGQLRGPLNLPHLTAKLEGNSLAFQDKSLKSLQANIDINLLTQKNLHLDVNATDLLFGTNKIDNFNLKGQGTTTHHTLQARVTMPKDSLSLKLQGGFNQPQWQGKLQQLDISSAVAGKWQLDSPAALTLSATEAQLTQSCLQYTPTGKLCTQLHWQKTADSAIQARLEQLPLNIVAAFLPQISKLTGNVNAKVAATLRPDGTIASDVTVNVSPGELTANLAENDIKKFSYQGGSLKLKMAKNGLATDLDFKLLDKTSIGGTLKLPRFTKLPLSGEQPIQGQIKATFADMDIIPIFAPQVEDSKGQVNMDMKLDGTLFAPQLQGQILLQNGAAHIIDLGIEIKDLNVKITGEGREPLQMHVSMKSGDGDINIDGTTNLRSATDWKVDLQIKGQNFEVVNIPDAWALASPDIKVSATPGRVEATGIVNIPEATITPAGVGSGSGAVVVSKDVVIVNPIITEEKIEEISQAYAISSNVEIILGDKVTFDGFNFKSSFGGDLVASNKPGKTTVFGNGEIYIIDGNYKAYGQNLKIDRGQVIFTGGAIENPGLDIQAYRQIKQRGEDDIIAGIHIQGTAQSPKMVLFSDPALDQTNILSYIIIGKPAAQASEDEGKDLLIAAAATQFQGGESLTKKIGQTFGLDEATISSEGGIEESALVLGKYLSPGLYISYGIGLLNNSNVFRIHYELTERLTLETETGTQSGVDLRYSFER